MAAIGSAAVLAAPGIIAGIRATEGSSMEADYIQVYYRLAHHLDPLHFAKSGWVVRVAWHPLLAAAHAALSNGLFVPKLIALRICRCGYRPFATASRGSHGDSEAFGFGGARDYVSAIAPA